MAKEYQYEPHFMGSAIHKLTANGAHSSKTHVLRKVVEGYCSGRSFYSDKKGAETLYLLESNTKVKRVFIFSLYNCQTTNKHTNG